MNCKTAILHFILLSNFLLGKFPIELTPNEMTEQMSFTAGSDTEFLLTITVSVNTNWSQTEYESATLVVAVDGNWIIYDEFGEILGVTYYKNGNPCRIISNKHFSCDEERYDYDFSDNDPGVGIMYAVIFNSGKNTTGLNSHFSQNHTNHG